jgi:hypothetical protein
MGPRRGAPRRADAVPLRRRTTRTVAAAAARRTRRRRPGPRPKTRRRRAARSPRTRCCNRLIAVRSTVRSHPRCPRTATSSPIAKDHAIARHDRPDDDRVIARVTDASDEERCGRVPRETVPLGTPVESRDERASLCHSFSRRARDAVTCDIMCDTLRRNASGALTGRRGVATVRPGPERPLGPGSGKRLSSDGSERTTRVGRTGSNRTGASHRRPVPGCSGPTFDGSRDRVDNARVWGRRERLQRSLGPSLSFPPWLQDHPQSFHSGSTQPRSLATGPRRGNASSRVTRAS